MHSSRVHKTSSTATATATATSSVTTASVTASGVSKPELAAGQRQQGSFADMLTTVHTPESTQIPPADQQAGLRLLAEVSTSQAKAEADPFLAITTHQTVSFDDGNQEQSASSLSLPADNADPIMIVEEYKLPSGENPVGQDFDSTNQRTMDSGNETRPYKCDYEGCNRAFARRAALGSHLISHTADLHISCYYGDCNGEIKYRNKRELNRHIHAHHTFKRPYECDTCHHRFRRTDHLKSHMEHVHAPGREKKKPPKLKKP